MKSVVKAEVIIFTQGTYVQDVVWSLCVGQSIYTSYEIERNEHNKLLVAVVRDGSILKYIS